MSRNDNTKKWVATHRDKFNDCMRKLMAKRRLDPVKREKMKEANRKWYQAHKKERNEKQRIYRANKKSPVN